MKKKFMTALLAVAMVATLTACGSKDAGETTSENSTAEAETAASSVSTKDYNPDDYVTIGDYEGIDVNVDVYNYTEEDVQSQMQDEFEYYVQYNDAYNYTATDKQTVEDGDVVNIDYTGTQDGVAFEGGSATGAHLTIGSNTFIDGFESGLVGHNVGEDVTLNLTFPEGYTNADLAGKAVVFAVTINSIDEGTMPELDDAMVAQLGLGFTTVEEYRADIENYLKESVEEQNQSGRDAAVWQAVYATCEVSAPPQEMVDDIKTRIAANAQAYADSYSVELSEFITTYMGMTQEQYDQEIQTSAEDSAKEKLAVAAIAKQAGIEVTDEDLKASAEADYESYGYESADALFAEVGEGAYYDYVLTDKVDEYLMDHVNIIEGEPVSILADQAAAAEDTEAEVTDEETDTTEIEAETDATAEDAAAEDTAEDAEAETEEAATDEAADTEAAE